MLSPHGFAGLEVLIADDVAHALADSIRTAHDLLGPAECQPWSRPGTRIWTDPFPGRSHTGVGTSVS